MNYKTSKFRNYSLVFICLLMLASIAVAGSKETVLHSFDTFNGGLFPMSGVIEDASGNLYGVTSEGGVGKAANGYGTVFELSPVSNGWTEKVLYRFAGGADGVDPDVKLVMDQAGNLYGGTCCGGQSNAGTIFELTPQNGSWTKATIYSFSGTDGNNPSGALVFDQSGNLYGECAEGGKNGDGLIFELSPPAQQGNPWTESVLYSFGSVTKNHDGAWPNGGLVFDGNGNLYGTTTYGGSGGKPRTCSSAGCGVVFELSPPAQQGDPWTETVLHNFTGVKDGSHPQSGTIFSKGKLYGTTLDGGTINWSGLGTVFQVSPAQGGTWTESVIYRFSHDPGVPKGALWGLTADQAGNLYGTTLGGGSAKNCPNGQCGAVYELQPPAGKGNLWTEKTLFQFGGLDGLEPVGSLLLSNSGTLYGATEYGGAKRNECKSGGCGTVFQIVP